MSAKDNQPHPNRKAIMFRIVSKHNIASHNEALKNVHLQVFKGYKPVEQSDGSVKTFPSYEKGENLYSARFQTIGDAERAYHNCNFVDGNVNRSDYKIKNERQVK